MKSIIFIFLSIVGLTAFSQDPHFSQYQTQQQWLNPANAGSFDYSIRAATNYRTQWNQAGFALRTFAVGADGTITGNESSKLFCGVQYMRDSYDETAFMQSFANLNIGSGIKLSDNKFLQAAVGIGLIGQKIDPLAFSYSSQFNGFSYDPTLPNNENFPDISSNKFDLSAGIKYSFCSPTAEEFNGAGTKGAIGFGLFHLNNPSQISSNNTIEDNRGTRYVLHGSFSIKPNKGEFASAFQPSFLFMHQSHSNEFTIGLGYRTLFGKEMNSSSITIGIDYRLQDAIIVRTMLDYKRYAVGFSYDFNVSDLSKTGGNKSSMEISIRALFPAFEKDKRDIQLY